jgi:hypothetical protein
MHTIPVPSGQEFRQESGLTREGQVQRYIRSLHTCTQAALCTATGALAGYGYLLWVCYDVDRVTGEDETPMRDVDQIQGVIPRRIAKILLGLRLALTSPRLLVCFSCTLIADSTH